MKKVILMAGLGQPSTFIQRRILAGNQQGLELIVEVTGKISSWLIENQIQAVSVEPNKKLKNIFLFLFALVRKPILTSKYFFYFIKVETKGIGGSVFMTGAMAPLFWMKRPHIIHVHWTYLSSKYLILARHFNAKLVTSVRGSQVTISPIFSEKAQIELKKSIECTDYFHCVSESMKAAILSHGAKQPCFVNYNGIQIEKFSTVPFSEKSSKFNIISVGLMIWRKNFIMALQVAFELKKRGVDFEWNFYGKGVERVALIYLVQKLNLQNNVRINEPISEKELIQLFQKSHILVSTSVGEGLANVVVEAMACGCVPVVWDCEGMSEAIVNEKTGYIISFGDANEMVEIIEHLASNPNKTKELSENAAERIKSHFDEAVHSKKMLDWYQSILEEKQRFNL
jgi:colanic acid/amylovoran biosynthesis glycosyltransferase